MKCRRAKALIYDFIDGMIDDQDRIALETHLGSCSSCEKLAAGLSKSLEFLHRAPQVKPGENFNWKIRLGIAKARNAVGDEVVSARAWMRSWNIRFAVSALSAFVAVAATGYLMVKSDMIHREAGVNLTSSSQTNETRGSVDAERSASRPDFVANGPIRPSAVSTDGQKSRGRLGEGGLLEEVPLQSLNTDSLRNVFLRSQISRYRVEQLQQQVDVLQRELRDCEGQDK